MGLWVILGSWEGEIEPDGRHWERVSGHLIVPHTMLFLLLFLLFVFVSTAKRSSIESVHTEISNQPGYGRRHLGKGLRSPDCSSHHDFSFFVFLIWERVLGHLIVPLTSLEPIQVTPPVHLQINLSQRIH